MMNAAPHFVARRRGFSLVEILVTVALLSVIILGLVAMFNQTRRAFISSITQVDVLESGRSTADLIAREIEQMTAAGSLGITNFYVDTTSAIPLVQNLLDPNDFRTNNLEEVFFLSRLNQTWSAIGYAVFPGNGIGALYRFGGNGIVATNGPLLSLQWSNFNRGRLTGAPTTNFVHIMDGVVNFSIKAFNPNGQPITFSSTPSSFITVFTNAAPLDGTINYAFSGSALPAYVEIELAVLEDRALARYQALTPSSFPSPTQAARDYLANHPGQVHIFRQRIPIRNFNSSAYQ